MVFSSPTFLFLFFPLFMAGYYLLFAPVQLSGSQGIRRLFLTLSNGFILGSSLLFYFWGESWLILLMLASTVVDYCCGLFMSFSDKPRHRRHLLLTSITTNLTILFFFKYLGWGMGTYNEVVASLGFNSLRYPIMDIALPLGISFYTFQSMSYTIDVYRGEVEPTRNFFDFACYVTMFPQLVAGPIVRYRDVAAQLRERSVSVDDFSTGCLRFILGLGKKVLIANAVAVPADAIFGLPASQLATSLAWVGTVCYSIQIYFDFSGYSDMAIGLGGMLGFRFPENFNYPYAAKSIQEFWRRWHISLSTWFRDYLYIPLGGGRASPVRVYVNLVIVFVLCGLWHGAAWVFLVWGLYHGAFLVTEKLGLSDWLKERPLLFRHGYVILATFGGWVLFRSESLAQAVSFFVAMAGFGPTASPYEVQMIMTKDAVLAVVLGSLFSFPLLPWIVDCFLATEVSAAGRKQSVLRVIGSAATVVFYLSIALLAAMSLASGAHNPFIYFRF